MPHALRLPGRFLLAPLAGVTDAVFRQECKAQGAALTCTELTSIEGIIRNEDTLSSLLDVRKGERPAIQLFGSSIPTLIKAARIVEPLASVIDLNIGCPAPHITAQEAGAALLAKPDHVRRMVEALVESVDLPVTAKIRAGPNESTLVYKEVALALQVGGASMVTLHPRTVAQRYSGAAHWPRIKELVETLDIPVCGNGDVTTPEKAKLMLEKTGCRYVMIGRAAMGNPFLFRQCDDYLKQGSYLILTEEQRRQAWESYLAKALAYGIPFPRLKTQAMLYTHGLERAKERRAAIGKATSVDDLRAAFF